MKKVKYDRIRVPHKRYELSRYDLDGKSLEDLILYLKNIHHEHEKECINDDIECIFNVDHCYDDVELYLQFNRWETDDEFKRRVEKNEKARLKAAESRAKTKQKKKEIEEKQKNEEYQNYLKLKEKYESPN